MNYSQEIGVVGERVARQFLEMRGYNFVAANVKSRGGEIDLVMHKGGCVYFVEVKTRRQGNAAGAGNDVGNWKWRRMRRAISAYVAQQSVEDWCGMLVTVTISQDRRTAKVTALEI